MLRDTTGVFVFADFRLKTEMPALESLIDEYFEVIKSEDIRRNVFHALGL